MEREHLPSGNSAALTGEEPRDGGTKRLAFVPQTSRKRRAFVPTPAAQPQPAASCIGTGSTPSARQTW